MDIATNIGISGRPAEHPPTVYGWPERRCKPRIKGPFPIVVHGVDVVGDTFEIKTVIDNISAGGLYVKIGQRVEPGATLFFHASLSSVERVVELAPRLLLHGVVLRSELTHGSACGVAVAFSHYRFL